MTPSQAYRLVRSAIQNGRLVRPENCSSCGVKNPRARDGRLNIHAHHHDYNKPLDVEWLCAKCHRKVTPLPDIMGASVFGDANGMRKYPGLMRGSKNSFARLTEGSVGRILEMKGCRVSEIARAFNVRPSTIYDIFERRTWKHVTSAAPKVDSPAAETTPD